MSPCDILFCSRKLRMVSPMFMRGSRPGRKRPWYYLHSNEGTSRWQVKSYRVARLRRDAAIHGALPFGILDLLRSNCFYNLAHGTPREVHPIRMPPLTFSTSPVM